MSFSLHTLWCTVESKIPAHLYSKLYGYLCVLLSNLVMSSAGIKHKAKFSLFKHWTVSVPFSAHLPLQLFFLAVSAFFLLSHTDTLFPSMLSAGLGTLSQKQSQGFSFNDLRAIIRLIRTSTGHQVHFLLQDTIRSVFHSWSTFKSLERHLTLAYPPFAIFYIGLRQLIHYLNC